MYNERIGGVSAVFRNALAESLKGLHVTVEPMSLKVDHDISLSEALTALATLQGVGQSTNTEIRFAKGDFFLWLPVKFGDKKELFRQAFGANFEGIYQEFCANAWIAKKWPADKRNGSLPWSYFKNNKPVTVHSDRYSKTVDSCTTVQSDSSAPLLVGRLEEVLAHNHLTAGTVLTETYLKSKAEYNPERKTVRFKAGSSWVEMEVVQQSLDLWGAEDTSEEDDFADEEEL